MPTINVLKSDLEKLIGRTYTLDELEEELLIAKGELKGYDPDSDELKLELNDTNRPDLWSAEGLARQIRSKRLGKGGKYGFYARRPATAGNRHRVIVDERLRRIRPYVSCFRARGVELTDALLGQIIESQDKLAENLGRKRSVAAIGLSRAAAIKFPVRFKAGDPDTDTFVPLEMESPLTLRRILEEHPTGRQYGPIIASETHFPLLADSADNVISMPPVINSRGLGEVTADDTDFFVDVTGTDQTVVMLAANIIAADLADRGGRIVPVTTVYPYDTPLGREVPAPYDLSSPARVELALINRVLGQELRMDEVRRLLVEMGHRKVTAVGRGRRELEIWPQPFRADLMHPVDVVEDVAISRGYQSFEPIMPERFTVGKSDAMEEFSRRVREMLVGAGFQECLSPVLTSREALVKKMRLEGQGEDELVEIDNVMSELFSTVRNSLLPSLLNVEAVSSKASYPHKIFEAGEVAKVETDHPDGTRTLMQLAACIAHPKASFSELHSYLDALLFYLRLKYSLEPTSHPSFLDGRVGGILVEADGSQESVGIIGEIHPEVLERWGIAMPVSAFELSLSRLHELCR